ncbi:GTP cyclohydrolase N terminal-domain-containing protein [Nemania abortiva]|nr:GTP cyclohydrolase N terminal-domain-containing protein [Nemania abortiva]
MASSGSSTGDVGTGVADILQALKAIQENQTKLAADVESVSNRLDTLAPSTQSPVLNGKLSPESTLPAGPALPQAALATSTKESPSASKLAEEAGFTSRIILTTYPKQIGINPIPLTWGAPGPERGPVVVSRSSSTIRKRNAHGGSYSIYFALALASKQLNVNHRPDFTNTEPAANIGPFRQWSDKKKIVAMDPWGHLAPWLYEDIMQKENESVRSGRLVPDGKVCLNESGELAVTKFAVEPVWYLPGVAERFGIGGLTVYCFGDPAKMSDESVRLSLRIHDECNGSDVFGSDICTCRPYLIFGIEEAVKEAQNGGSGVVIYFRKEGRALGEVTKVIVYNARKRGEDRASDYFKRTENIAGVKDMRFQALMPDILHWLGIKKIDRMLSMSNMKHDAIVGQGIPIHERVELPEELIPADSRVEIDAKITAGYFTTGHRMTEDELQAVKGRMWEEYVFSTIH